MYISIGLLIILKSTKMFDCLPKPSTAISIIIFLKFLNNINLHWDFISFNFNSC